MKEGVTKAGVSKGPRLLSAKIDVNPLRRLSFLKIHAMKIQTGTLLGNEQMKVRRAKSKVHKSFSVHSDPWVEHIRPRTFQYLNFRYDIVALGHRADC